MWKDKSLLLLLATLSMAASQGCVFGSSVALSPEAKHVQIVHESDRPLDCENRGKISGRAHASDEKEAKKNAENEFRNQAADLKANFAYVEAERSGPRGTSSQREVFIGGQALFCRTEEMKEAEEKRQEEAQKAKEEEEQRAKDEKERAEQEAKEKAEAEKAEKAEKEKKK
ncbi:MAG TPA: DUF4156 domain-containing protein [Polyangiaceae bacterium]|nr:DUF4156 domain-containing protein [Polyangiaceae bacterium]